MPALPTLCCHHTGLPAAVTTKSPHPTLVLSAHVGVLAPFSRLAKVDLHFFAGADLAALPHSVRSVTLRLPGTEWVLAQVQRAHSQLPFEEQPSEHLLAARVAAAYQQQQEQAQAQQPLPPPQQEQQQQQLVIELTAGKARGPAALAELLAGGLPAVQVYVASTDALHPPPEQLALEAAGQVGWALFSKTLPIMRMGPSFFFLKLPKQLAHLRRPLLLAALATGVLSFAVSAVKQELSRHRAAAAAVDGRLTFVVAPPGFLGPFVEELFPQYLPAAQGLGQVLRDSLSAVLALGTLHPLIKASSCCA